MIKFTKNNKICLLNASGRPNCYQSSIFFKKIELFFRFNNYFLANDPHQADVLIFNTCGVTDQKARINIDAINKFIKSDKKIIIFGCLCKISPEIKNSGCLLIPSEAINKFSNYFRHTISMEEVNPTSSIESCESDYDYKGSPLFIAQGCMNKCSYCNIRIAKGRIKSRSAADIIKDALSLVKGKNYDIVLVADDCGSYGHDRDTDIVQLIDKILNLDRESSWSFIIFSPAIF